MSWLDRLLGRDPPEVQTERAKDKQALNELHDAFDNVQERTDRLERELVRVNKEIRQRLSR